MLVPINVFRIAAALAVVALVACEPCACTGERADPMPAPSQAPCTDARRCPIIISHDKIGVTAVEEESVVPALIVWNGRIDVHGLPAKNLRLEFVMYQVDLETAGADVETRNAWEVFSACALTHAPTGIPLAVGELDRDSVLTFTSTFDLSASVDVRIVCAYNGNAPIGLANRLAVDVIKGSAFDRTVVFGTHNSNPAREVVDIRAFAGTEHVLATYEEEAEAYRAAHALPAAWLDWVVAHKVRYTHAFVRGRRHPSMRVNLAFENPVFYDPTWESDAEHARALKTLEQLRYPGWTFTFGFDLAQPDVTAYLGSTFSASEYVAQTRSVHLIYETIFGHEAGHALGLTHHFCNAAIGVTCKELPPAEGPCIMNKDGNGWGHTERFVLNLGDSSDEDIRAAVMNIARRRP